MVNIFLCDDELEVREKYACLMYEIAKRKGIKVNITAFSSGEALLFNAETCLSEIDLIFFDIEMHGMNGLKAANKIRSLGYKGRIIFLTSIKDYVFDCFKAKPLDYVLKFTLTEKKFEEMFLGAINNIFKNENKTLVLKNASELKLISVKDVLFVESRNKQMIVHFGNNETFSFYSTLEKVLVELKEHNFVRIHKTYIINLNYVKGLKKQSLLLDENVEIPIGRKYVRDIKELFSHYLIKSQYMVKLGGE